MSRRDSSRLPYRHPSNSARGFSVIELLVALGVLLVVAVIGIPSLLSQLARVRLESSANDVANLIRQTRLRAIRDNQQYTVEVVDDEKVVGETVIGSTEQSQVELELNNPPIAVYPGGGIAQCQSKYDGTGGSWGGTSMVYDSTGVAGDTGAICVWDGGENILQVVIEFPAAQPKVRKFLKTGDSPATGGAQGFFEKTSAVTADSTWVWY